MQRDDIAVYRDRSPVPPHPRSEPNLPTPLARFSESQARPATVETPPSQRGAAMIKYFLAWLLGVPAGILVLIYLFTHFF